MAKTRKGTNKSEAIRGYLASHPKSSPNEIVAALGEEGIKISAGLASNVKYTSSAKRRTKKKAGQKRLVTRRIPSRTAAAELSADDLIAAKQLVDRLGGLEAARRALDTLESLR